MKFEDRKQVFRMLCGIFIFYGGIALLVVFCTGMIATRNTALHILEAIAIILVGAWFTAGNLPYVDDE